jgi:gluconokinase
VWRYRVDRQRSVLGVAYSAGGVIYDWLTDVLRGPDGKITDAELDGLVPGAHGLVALPFHAGHRAPMPALGAGGTLHGLRLTTTSLDIAAATLEGVCHEIAAGAAVLTPSGDATATLGGGAVSASPWFARRLTAALGGVLNTSTARVATDAEVGARGAAACATGRVYEPETTEIHATRAEVAAMADAGARHRALRDLLLPDLP